jgi:hypothetical protein
VAFTIVPDILEQLVAEVNVVAPPQSSFEGGGGLVTQILKAPSLDGNPASPEYTRM